MVPKKASAESFARERSKIAGGSILHGSLSFLIYRSHRTTAHAWVTRWGEGGMRYNFYNAFVLVGANPGILVVELAQRLGIDKSRASELADAMEKEHLISRRRLTSDHRSFGIYLTPDATTKLASLIEEVRLHEERSIDGLFSDEERQTLIELLSRVASVR